MFGLKPVQIDCCKLYSFPDINAPLKELSFCCHDPKAPYDSCIRFMRDICCEYTAAFGFAVDIVDGLSDRYTHHWPVRAQEACAR